MRKSIYILMAFVMYVSSVGLIINRHYCQNELKHAAFFWKAKSCKPAKQISHCPFHPPQDTPDEKGCCDNESQYLNADQDQTNPSIADASVQEVDLTMLPFYLYEPALLSVWNGGLTDYLHYKPPPLLTDPVIIYQVFRC